MVAFNNAQVLSRSWYRLCGSSELSQGKAQSFEFFDFRIAAFRDEAGQACALYATCPHMGVDLGQGQVLAGQIVCPYHKWRFNSAGTCTHIPTKYKVRTASVTSFPVVEKYGSVWFFNGEKADFPFPELEWSDKDHYVIPLPIQKLKCHPHIIGTNNPDFLHLELLHGLSLHGVPEQNVSEHEIKYSYEINFRPKNWFDAFFSFISGKIFRFRIRQYGPSNIIMDISSKNYHFNTWISLTPTRDGQTRAKMYLFLPKGSAFRRLFYLNFLKLPLLVASILKIQMQDLMVYNHIDFILPEGEETLVKHRNFIEKFGVFHPKDASRTSAPKP